MLGITWKILTTKELMKLQKSLFYTISINSA